MSPTFPTFTQLDTVHKQTIDAYTSNFDPYSDFNFTSLLSWNTDSTTEFTFLDGNLVIRQPDYITGEPIFSILGSSNINSSIDSLLEITNELKLVPEIVASNTDREKYSIQEDPDNHDYVYDLSRIVSLEGGALKKKRNKVNTTLRYFSDRLQIVHHETVSEKLANEISHIFNEWGVGAKQLSDSIQAERTALKSLLTVVDALNVITSVAYLDGQPVAFSINEILPKCYGICHFEKATPVHPHLASVLAVIAAGHLQERGCKYVNWEQDLGIDGLRASKLSFKPDSYFKKYIVSKK